MSVAGDAVNNVSQCVVESSISLTAGAAAVITGRDPTPLPVSIATIQLLSVGGALAALRPSDYPRSAEFDSDRQLRHSASSLIPFVGRGRSGRARLAHGPQDGVAGAKTIPRRQRVLVSGESCDHRLRGDRAVIGARQTHDKIARHTPNY